MIDFSNEIFNAVATDLRSFYPGVKVVGENVDTPTSFPTVTIDETHNTPVHMDSAVHNKYARVQYRVQVFTNKKSGKRAQARKLYARVDEKLQVLGFYATSYSATPAIYNSDVYCITAIYSGVIDRNGVVYRG